MTAGRLPDPYLMAGTSSFAEFARTLSPEVLPSLPEAQLAPHGTTIVALRGEFGIVKVFAADEHSVIGIAGTAGIAVELVRLFQVELEHYEKIEGVALSLDGKANRLAALIRANLPMAIQGLAVVPLFAGFDHGSQRGRIFSYDLTGGRYEEHDFYAVGSGSMFARGSLKKLYDPSLTTEQALIAALEALYDAADDDSATAGPDLTRGIYPVLTAVDAAGVRMLQDQQVAALVATMMDQRRQRPDGPRASLGGTR